MGQKGAKRLFSSKQLEIYIRETLGHGDPNSQKQTSKNKNLGLSKTTNKFFF